MKKISTNLYNIVQILWEIQFFAVTEKNVKIGENVTKLFHEFGGLLFWMMVYINWFFFTQLTANYDRSATHIQRAHTKLITTAWHENTHLN